jgi:hypothetical protein
MKMSYKSMPVCFIFPDFRVIFIRKTEVPILGAFRGIKSVFCVPWVYFC